MGSEIIISVTHIRNALCGMQHGLHGGDHHGPFKSSASGPHTP